MVRQVAVGAAHLETVEVARLLEMVAHAQVCHVARHLSFLEKAVRKSFGEVPNWQWHAIGRGERHLPLLLHLMEQELGISSREKGRVCRRVAERMTRLGRLVHDLHWHLLPTDHTVDRLHRLALFKTLAATLCIDGCCFWRSRQSRDIVHPRRTVLLAPS